MKFICENNHLIDIPTKSEKKLLRKAEKLLIVCPNCKPKNVRLTVLEDDKFSGKHYVCRHGHLTTIYPFSNGVCNISYGSEQENLDAEPEEIQVMINSGNYKCKHPVLKRKCNCKLKEIDNTPLSKPSTVGIKTRTRVGDIWDKAGCPEPKDSSVNIETRGGKAYDAHLNETEFSKRNKIRVKKIRKKFAERNTKAAGEIIDKPTNRSYKEVNAKPPKKSD